MPLASADAAPKAKRPSFGMRITKAWAARKARKANKEEVSSFVHTVVNKLQLRFQRSNSVDSTVSTGAIAALHDVPSAPSPVAQAPDVVVAASPTPTILTATSFNSEVADVEAAVIDAAAEWEAAEWEEYDDEVAIKKSVVVPESEVVVPSTVVVAVVEAESDEVVRFSCMDVLLSGFKKRKAKKVQIATVVVDGSVAVDAADVVVVAPARHGAFAYLRMKLSKKAKKEEVVEGKKKKKSGFGWLKRVFKRSPASNKN